MYKLMGGDCTGVVYVYHGQVMKWLSEDSNNPNLREEISKNTTYCAVLGAGFELDLSSVVDWGDSPLIYDIF